MNQSKFLLSKVIDSEKMFDKALEDESFYDILPIDKQACLCLYDSMVLNSKCIQSCPAFVYSASKLILWRTYLFIASAFAGYDRRRTRLTLTDTDRQGWQMTNDRQRTTHQPIHNTNKIIIPQPVTSHTHFMLQHDHFHFETSPQSRRKRTNTHPEKSKYWQNKNNTIWRHKYRIKQR